MSDGDSETEASTLQNKLPLQAACLANAAQLLFATTRSRDSLAVLEESVEVLEGWSPFPAEEPPPPAAPSAPDPPKAPSPGQCCLLFLVGVRSQDVASLFPQHDGAPGACP